MPEGGGGRQPKIFVSYSCKDHDFAGKLCRRQHVRLASKPHVAPAVSRRKVCLRNRTLWTGPVVVIGRQKVEYGAQASATHANADPMRSTRPSPGNGI